MSSRSNNNGRAYEYACLRVLEAAIKDYRRVEIVHNTSFEAAYNAWTAMASNIQSMFITSAKAIIKTIFALEPRIIETKDDVLYLYIQSDVNGQKGDVRDIIIERSDIKWEIGLSIKHNHLAVKHCRIAQGLDFGESWYGVKCSRQYWMEVAPVFAYLNEQKSKNTTFNSLRNKTNDVYQPLLKAFINEISTQVKKDKKIPFRLVQYLLSKFDFYKVISVDNLQLTTIQSFNMLGTLNLPSDTTTPSLVIPKLLLPTTLLHIGMKPKSNTTVLMTFDNGWQFSFRIHNAEKYVIPSLKFDIQIIGMPSEVNVKFNCSWNNESN